ncbi:MAG: hypothetical protein CMH30_04730 [Micavibrio sp.]|nr:hypothetical protein [Micavibrio sp.]|tara:strand:+ start:356 stop:559 length:204 start_codon:yes stop_codon:yes gene_type:complete
MNTDILKGNFKQLQGDIQKRWGKLTNDNIARTEGNRKKLVGAIQEEYGIAKDEAEKQVAEFEKSHAA